MVVAISIGALAVSAFSAFFAWRQLKQVERGLGQAEEELRQAKKANEVPAITSLFAEYRSPEMVAARKLLRTELPVSVCPLHDLPAPIANAAELVGHYLDHLGVLVHFNLLEPEVVSGFVGLSAQNVWSQLQPYIDCERAKREGHVYLNFFENLVVALDRESPQSVMKTLRTVSRAEK